MKKLEEGMEPCPFCGRPAEIEHNATMIRLGCSGRRDCPGHNSSWTVHENLEKGLERWNRRAGSVDERETVVHCCGSQGFDPTKGDSCPACETDE